MMSAESSNDSFTISKLINRQRPRSIDLWSSKQNSRVYPKQDALDHLFRSIQNKRNSFIDEKLTRKAMSIKDINGANTFYNYLFRIEKWSRLFRMNLLEERFLLTDDGQNVTDGGRFSVHIWRLFIWILLAHQIFLYVMKRYKLKEEFHRSDLQSLKHLLYIGDLSIFDRQNFDSYSGEIFRICWGLYAAIIYQWVTKSSGQNRRWLFSFNKLFTRTAYYVNKDFELMSQKKSQKYIFLIKFMVQNCSVFCIIVMLIYAILGIRSERGQILLLGEESQNKIFHQALYVIWTIIYMIWFFVISIINLTSFGHHFVLCHAINIVSMRSN
ncbi:hypothetical protein SSS_07388 [Sarcoptes scabiei]|uniref:Uncharacterized protein n=1 Tax=Sarcoptes scabiei TaxID=52283 RepID=A0A834VG74_SARSC|nr:hypothetical protein SSS_07388 [Sarcoptes scabiei]